MPGERYRNEKGDVLGHHSVIVLLCLVDDSDWHPTDTVPPSLFGMGRRGPALCFSRARPDCYRLLLSEAGVSKIDGEARSNKYDYSSAFCSYFCLLDDIHVVIFYHV